LEKTEVEEHKGEETTETMGEDSSTYPSTLQSAEMEAAESKEREKFQAEMEEKFEELLRTIREETLQLSEFLIEERKLTHELYVLLKPILKQLNTSFHVPTNVVPFQERAKHVFLNAEGHLIIIDERNGVSSKALEDCSPEVILNVLRVVIPALSESIMAYRKTVSLRVTLFNKITRELKNLYKIFLKRQERPEEAEDAQKEKSQENGIRKSLLSRK